MPNDTNKDRNNPDTRERDNERQKKGGSHEEEMGRDGGERDQNSPKRGN